MQPGMKSLSTGINYHEFILKCLFPREPWYWDVLEDGAHRSFLRQLILRKIDFGFGRVREVVDLQRSVFWGKKGSLEVVSTRMSQEVDVKG